MYPRTAIVTLAAVFLVTTMGCVTSGGSSSGWVVVGQPASSPPPASQKARPPKSKKNTMGQETAARNHIRSAYRFLEKGKPDHAMREMEKARNKMGNTFWFHYYMGGAYYFKGMYERAGDSWKMAYRYTNDYRLKSRLRTSQSFAVHHLKGDEPSIGFLRMAIDTDGDNRYARELLEDLVGSGGGPSDLGYSGSKGKKGPDKDDRKPGKSAKKKEKSKKIRDKDRFRAFFMIEMP